MFKKYQPLHSVLEDNWGAIANHVVGNTLVAVFFLSIGLCILIYAGHAKDRGVAQWIGWCFIFCALSRSLSVLCVWHGYYVLAGLVSTFTGLVSIVALYFMIGLIRRIEQLKSISELQKEIETQEIKLNTLQDLKNENNAASTNNMV